MKSIKKATLTLLCSSAVMLSAQSKLEDEWRVQAENVSSAPYFSFRATPAQFGNREFDDVYNLARQGVSSASILLYATSRGVDVSDAIRLIVSAAPGRADEVYSVATRITAWLPGGACGSSSRTQLGPIPRYHVTTSEILNSSGGNVIDQVASQFFDNNRIVLTTGEADVDGYLMPSHTVGFGNAMVSVSELQQIASRSGAVAIRSDGSIGRYYGLNGGLALPIPVYFFKNDRSVVVGRPDVVNALANEGVVQAHVIFIQLDEKFVPISQLSGVSLNEVARNIFQSRTQVAPVLSSEVGEYHMRVSTQELRELFVDSLPQLGDVSAERRSQIMASQDSPIQITLNGGALWIDQPDRLVVLADSGVVDLPVLLISHLGDRRISSGEAMSCFQTQPDSAQLESMRNAAYDGNYVLGALAGDVGNSTNNGNLPYNVMVDSSVTAGMPSVGVSASVTGEGVTATGTQSVSVSSTVSNDTSSVTASGTASNDQSVTATQSVTASGTVSADQSVTAGGGGPLPPVSVSATATAGGGTVSATVSASASAGSVPPPDPIPDPEPEPEPEPEPDPGPTTTL